jgi:hypothetical protein
MYLYIYPFRILNSPLLCLNKSRQYSSYALLFRGYVGPGGLGEGYPQAENCTGGMAGYIDKKLFGVNHIYGHPTSKVSWSF